ncbi:MAG: hypothetical protein GY822_22300 [Deltaproteobacteria bacterium]|nr:hypothetical protein [Deltaproteobacteria bacterium]
MKEKMLNDDVKLQSASDIRLLQSKQISVSVTSLGEVPVTSNELRFQTRSSCHLTANFSGKNGAHGEPGNDAPEPGNFQDGLKGRRGRDGELGRNGSHLSVVVFLADENHLQACVGRKLTFPNHWLDLNVDNSICYLLRVNQSSLLVRADGGNGGHGGEGGQGSFGKPGTLINGVTDSRGDEGIGGKGAAGGNGGDIDVVFSEAAMNFRSQFEGGRVCLLEFHLHQVYKPVSPAARCHLCKTNIFYPCRL